MLLFIRLYSLIIPVIAIFARPADQPEKKDEPGETGEGSAKEKVNKEVKHLSLSFHDRGRGGVIMDGSPDTLGGRKRAHSRSVRTNAAKCGYSVECQACSQLESVLFLPAAKQTSVANAIPLPSLSPRTCPRGRFHLFRQRGNLIIPQTEPFAVKALSNEAFVDFALVCPAALARADQL